ARNSRSETLHPATLVALNDNVAMPSRLRRSAMPVRTPDPRLGGRGVGDWAIWLGGAATWSTMCAGGGDADGGTSTPVMGATLTGRWRRSPAAGPPDGHPSGPLNRKTLNWSWPSPVWNTRSLKQTVIQN